MAAKLPFKYTGAVVLGSNISGTLTSIISIFTSFFASSVKTAAIYYFIGAMFVLLACFDTYFALPLNVSSHRSYSRERPWFTIFSSLQRFYRYHELMHEKEAKKNKKVGQSISSRPPYFYIFRKAFPQLFNVFFTFFITLNLFPSVQSGKSAETKPISRSIK